MLVKTLSVLCLRKKVSRPSNMNSVMVHEIQFLKLLKKF